MEQRVRHSKEASANFRDGATLNREGSKQKVFDVKAYKKKSTTLRGTVSSKCLLLVLLLGLILLAPQISTPRGRHQKVTVQISRRHARLRQHSDIVESNSRMVTVVMTGCDAAAAWQSLGLYYSFLR